MTAAKKKPDSVRVQIAKIQDQVRREAKPTVPTVAALKELRDLGSIEELRESEFHCESLDEYLKLAIKRRRLA